MGDTNYKTAQTTMLTRSKTNIKEGMKVNESKNKKGGSSSLLSLSGSLDLDCYEIEDEVANCM